MADSPFRKNNRDFWKSDKGDLFSVNAGNDPTNDYPNWKPASEQDWIKRQEEKSYESSSLGNKIGEAAYTGLEEVVRTGAGLIETAAKVINPSTPEGEIIEGDPVKARDIAPGFYSGQSLTRRERHPIGTIAGQIPIQAPVTLLTGGTSIPGQVAAGLGRAAMYGTMTEANESVVDDRPFSVEHAAVDGALAGVFEGATLLAPAAFKKAGTFFDDKAKRAVQRGLRDASINPDIKLDGNTLQSPEEIITSRQEVLRDLENAADEALQKEDDILFSVANIKKQIPNNPAQQTGQAELRINDLDSVATRLKEDLAKREADSIAEAAAAAHPEQFNAWVDDLERNFAEQRKVSTAEGEGPRELELHSDGQPLVDQSTVAQKRIDEFRRKQTAKSRGEDPSVEPPYDPRVEEFPPIPENEKLFGIGEDDVRKPWEEEDYLGRALRGAEPIPQSRPMHGVQWTDNAVGPVHEEGEFAGVIPDPEPEDFIRVIREEIKRGNPGPAAVEPKSTGNVGAATESPQGMNWKQTRRAESVEEFLERQKTGESPDEFIARKDKEAATGGKTKPAEYEATTGIPKKPSAEPLAQTEIPPPPENIPLQPLKNRIAARIESMAENAPTIAHDILDSLDNLELQAPKDFVHEVPESLRGLDEFLNGEILADGTRAPRFIDNMTELFEKGVKPEQIWKILRDNINIINRNVAASPEIPIYAKESINRLEDFVNDETIWGIAARMNKSRSIRRSGPLQDLVNNMSPDSIRNAQAKGGAKYTPENTVNGMGPEGFDEARLKGLADQLMKSKDKTRRQLGAKIQFMMDNLKAVSGSRFFDEFPQTIQTLSDLGRHAGPDLFKQAPIPYLGRIPGVRSSVGKGIYTKLREKYPGFIPSPEAARATKKSSAAGFGEVAGLVGLAAGGVPGMVAGSGAGALGKLAWDARREIADLGFAVVSDTTRKVAQILARPGYAEAVSNLRSASKVGGPLISSLAEFMQDAPDLRTAYEQKREMMARFDSDPSLLIEEMGDQWSDLHQDNPDGYNQLMGKMYEAMDFVRSKAPPTIGQSLIRRKGIPPSRIQMRQFALYFTAATNPSSVLDDLANGHGSMEQMEALRTVWPQIYGDLKAEVLSVVGENDTPPTVSQAQRLDTLFGFGKALDASLDWGISIRAETIRRQQEKSKGQGGKTSAKLGNTGSTPEGIAALQMFPQLS